MKYPAQIKIDKRIVRICREQSRKLPGCPRPLVGSFGHFVKAAIYDKLVSMLENPAYINELFEKDKK